MSEEFLGLLSLLHKSGLHYYTPACNRAAKDTGNRFGVLCTMHVPVNVVVLVCGIRNGEFYKHQPMIKL